MVTFAGLHLPVHVFQEAIIGQEIEIRHALQGFEGCLLALPVAMPRLLVRQTTGERTRASRTPGTSVLHRLLLTDNTFLRINQRVHVHLRRRGARESETDGRRGCNRTSLTASIESNGEMIDVMSLSLDTSVLYSLHWIRSLCSGRLVRSLHRALEDVSTRSIRPSSVASVHQKAVLGLCRPSNVPLRCLSSLREVGSSLGQRDSAEDEHQ